MKLYLSSIGLPDIAAFSGLFSTSKPNIGLIPNAWDVAPQKVRKPYIERTRAQLESAGAAVHMLDLLQSSELTGLDGIWLMGGNTFYLNWAIHQAKLPQKLKKVGEAFIFGGESAGAIVAGTTLHGIEFLDDPKEAPKIIWHGLQLVNYGIIPHWDTPEDQSALQKAKTEMSQVSSVTTLTDDDFIIL